MHFLVILLNLENIWLEHYTKPKILNKNLSQKLDRKHRIRESSVQKNSNNTEPLLKQKQSKYIENMYL